MSEIWSWVGCVSCSALWGVVRERGNIVFWPVTFVRKMHIISALWGVVRGNIVFWPVTCVRKMHIFPALWGVVREGEHRVLARNVRA